jgi:GWxTD domain-containing protein
MEFVSFRTRFVATLMTGLLAFTAAGPLAAQTASTPATPNGASSGNGSPATASPGGGTASSPAASPSQAVQPGQDALVKRPDPKTVREAQKRWKSEVSRNYKDWLEKEVPYIITDEERAVFKQLATDSERDNFIEQFWLRRDPTPDTAENEFKEEHYRRIQYANERFAAGVPGWKTDRGMIYIKFGKPDEIESHPMGGPYQRPAEEGGGSTSTYPFEVWRYRYLEGIGQEVLIEFVDECGCGAYQMTMDRSKKDALKNVPNAGLTTYEEMGMANKSDRFRNFEQLGAGPFNQNPDAKEFDRLEQFYKLTKPPEIRFRDLDAVVTSKVRYNLLPFEVRADFVKMGDMVLVPITIQMHNKDVTWAAKDGVQRMVVNLYAKITTMTGRIAQTFEETVTDAVPADMLPRVIDGNHLYWKAVPLLPGRYRMDVVLKDVNGDRIGTYSHVLPVPNFSDTLSSSTLILADTMEKVPTSSVGAGNFVLGDTKVRPRVDLDPTKPAAFKRSQRLNFWMQVYNLGIDEKTQKPSAVVDYEIVNVADNRAVLQVQESTNQMGNVRDQLTLAKSVPLTSLTPGTYRVTVKVKDNISQQIISPSASFVVEQ